MKILKVSGIIIFIAILVILTIWFAWVSGKVFNIIR